MQCMAAVMNFRGSFEMAFGTWIRLSWPGKCAGVPPGVGIWQAH